MSAVIEHHNPSLQSKSCQRAVESDQSTVFVDIYQQQTNIAIWRRNLSDNMQQLIASYLSSCSTLQMAMTVTPENAAISLCDQLGITEQNNLLIEDIARLVDMFCYLFDLNQAGLRLTQLDRAMCPRFHVDHVPCRLVTTYQGVGSQWLPDHTVDRTKLGTGNKGLTDEQSNIYSDKNDICQLTTGDVALLKGEKWEGNENGGLVHRSPALQQGEKRLLLTLDFMG